MSQATSSYAPHTASPARRSLRVPRRVRLGDPPLLRRVGNELAYTPTRCRVSASLLVGRINPWWQRFPGTLPASPDTDTSTRVPK